MKAGVAIEDFVRGSRTVLALWCDAGGVVRAANEGARRLLGDDEELLGQPLSRWARGADPEGLDLAALAKDPGVRHRLNLALGQASPETYYFRFYPLDSATLCVGEQDPGELLGLRDELMVANQDLNNLTRQLHKNAAELRKLNETKNRFLGMAAHDLRNPLGAIHGYSRILRRAVKELPPKKLALLERIEENSEFMLNMLNDLLDLTKIESGRLDLSVETHDLVPLLRRSTENNAVLAEHKGSEVTLRLPEPIAPVRCDAMKIEQVTNNLLSNAVKYSPAGSQTVVSAFNSGSHVIIEVRDQGPGIPSEEQDQLFGMFSKTSVRSTAGEKSTGLGLAIAQRIVLAHGGRIWVESAPGRGSTFSFSVPCAGAEAG